MFRQDLETVLFILGTLEVLRPFPVPSSPTILHTTKAELVTFCGQFFALPRGDYLLERVTGGPTLFRYHFSNFLSALGRVFSNFFYPFKVPFLSFYPLSRSQFFHSVPAQGLKMKYHVCSRMSKMRFCARSRWPFNTSFKQTVHPSNFENRCFPPNACLLSRLLQTGEAQTKP